MKDNTMLYYLLSLYQAHNEIYTYKNLTNKESTESIIEGIPFKDKTIKVMWSEMKKINRTAGYVYNYIDHVDIVINAKMSSEEQHKTIILLLPFAVSCIQQKSNQAEPYSVIKIIDLYTDDYKDIIAHTLFPSSICHETLDFYKLDKPETEEKAFVIAQYLSDKINVYPDLIEYQIKAISDIKNK